MTTEANKIAALSAEPAQEMTPTDEQVTEWAESFIRPVAFNRPIAIQIAVEAAKWVRSVIAADRASRLPEMGEGDWPALPEPDGYAALTPYGSKIVPPQEALGYRTAYPFYTANHMRAAMVAAVEAYKALVRGKT